MQDPGRLTPHLRSGRCPARSHRIPHPWSGLGASAVGSSSSFTTAAAAAALDQRWRRAGRRPTPPPRQRVPAPPRTPPRPAAATASQARVPEALPGPGSQHQQGPAGGAAFREPGGKWGGDGRCCGRGIRAREPRAPAPPLGRICAAPRARRAPLRQPGVAPSTQERSHCHDRLPQALTAHALQPPLSTSRLGAQLVKTLRSPPGSPGGSAQDSVRHSRLRWASCNLSRSPQPSASFTSRAEMSDTRPKRGDPSLFY